MLDYRIELARGGDINALRSLLVDFGRWSRAQAYCRGWGYPRTPETACIDDESAAVVDRAIGALKRSGRRNAWRAFAMWYLGGRCGDPRSTALAWRMGRAARRTRDSSRMTVHIIMALVETGEKIVLEALSEAF